MLTIQKVSIADCDRGPNDSPYKYVVCHDFDVNKALEWCDSEEEAEKVIQELQELGEIE